MRHKAFTTRISTARSSRIRVRGLPNNRPPPHVPTKREKSKRVGTRTPDGGNGRVQGIRLGRPQQHVGSTQDSRKSMSQTFTNCSKGAKDSALENRHRKWRTDSNGRTRAKRPSRLVSKKHCSPARAGPIHAGTERKSVGSEAWRQNEKDILANPAQRGSVATWTLLFPFVGPW